ncbi:hypothetical protein [Paenibacillus oryzisoli]|uniref:Uncharacterized protein n=1 Tax=Paenibacillus oryzisoli TaxID=1850517 RepID=A0A198A601_9BACL|nr:hypothetical protein [Paenibacillus oryzisoli]OAS16408.1 hypothetical protein A8708_20570 [Paenibacillus oryzisoli]
MDIFLDLWMKNKLKCPGRGISAYFGGNLASRDAQVAKQLAVALLRELKVDKFDLQRATAALRAT